MTLSEGTMIEDGTTNQAIGRFLSTNSTSSKQGDAIVESVTVVALKEYCVKDKGNKWELRSLDTIPKTSGIMRNDSVMILCF